METRIVNFIVNNAVEESLSFPATNDAELVFEQISLICDTEDSLTIRHGQVEVVIA